MTGTKLEVLFFFKDKTPIQVNNEFPELLPAIRKAKVKATKLGEENTVKARYHTCRHDEGGTCDEWVEI